METMKFIKNPLLIVITVFAVSVAVGIAVVLVYKQPNPADLTATISSGVQGEPQLSIESQPAESPEGIQAGPPSIPPMADLGGEEPKVISEPQVSRPKVKSPPSNPIANNTNPGSSNVIVSPSSVAAGESVTVIVSVPGSGDLSSIWQMDVYLESPSGLNSVLESIASIDGEGRRFGDIVVPQDAELGVWLVKTVEALDTAGGITSYHYGADIFTTFTVIAPQ
jgi:hypothetical protein